MSDQSIVTPPPPYYPPFPPRQPPRQNSGLAIASLVLGLVGVFVSWFTFGVPSLLALIFGIVAIRQTGTGWDKRGGRGMAVAGTVLGAVITVAGVLVSLLVVYSVGQAANEIDKSLNTTPSAVATTPSAAETSAPDVATTAPAQPLVLAVGQTLSISQSSLGSEEGTADITVTKVATAAAEPGEFGSKPDHGWYVIVYVKAAGISGSVDINTFNFHVRSSNGFRAEDSTYSDAWGSSFESGTLRGGEHTSGTIVFDAPTRHGQVMFGDYGDQVIGSWKF